MSESELGGIDAIEAHAEMLARRRALVFRVLRWLPLALGALLVVFGALSLVGAPAGHEENLKLQAELVADQKQVTSEAEASFEQAYADSLEEISSVRLSRLVDDRSDMSDILEAAAAGEESERVEALGLSLDDPFVAGFLADLSEGEVPGLSLPVSSISFSSVLVDVTGTDHTYFAIVDVMSDPSEEPAETVAAALRWTTDGERIASVSADWSRGSVLRS